MEDYGKRSVAEIIEEINKTYFLPDIQRNFVWRPDQVYALFDSIMRDYPINTFLFWIQKGADLKFDKIKKLEFVKTSKKEEKNLENTEMSSAKEYKLVLDGQQRLTTFFLVLKGNYIIYKKPYDLYFNILSGMELKKDGTLYELEREDGTLYEFKFFNNENKGSHFYENEEGGESKIWYRVKDIYDINVGNIYIEVSKISQDIQEKHGIELKAHKINAIFRLCQYLKTEKIIHYYPEFEKSYDRVLDIFVRTNSGGTTLSYSDLLFSTIKSKWDVAREKFEDLLFNINDNERYRFSNDFTLKTILVLNAKNSEQIRYKTKNFKPDLINKIQQDWVNIKHSIQLTINVIKDRLFLTNYKTIPSNNAIIPIVYWVYKGKFKGIGHGSQCIKNSQIDNIRVWLIKALLSGIFGGQSDTILYKCKEAIDKNSSASFPGESMEKKINTETNKSMKLDDEFLDNVSYNSTDSHLVLSICYGNSVDFKPIFKGNLPEQDHIFSKDELKKAGIPESKINCIYNIRCVGSAENKQKSKNSFSRWINSFKKEEREEILKKHLIPDGEWDIDCYQDFLNARKKLMESKFKY